MVPNIAPIRAYALYAYYNTPYLLPFGGKETSVAFLYARTVGIHASNSRVSSPLGSSTDTLPLSDKLKSTLPHQSCPTSRLRDRHMVCTSSAIFVMTWWEKASVVEQPTSSCHGVLHLRYYSLVGNVSRKPPRGVQRRSTTEA